MQLNTKIALTVFMVRSLRVTSAYKRMLGCEALQAAFEKVDCGESLEVPRLNDAEVGYSYGFCAALLEERILKWVETLTNATVEPDHLDFLFDLYTRAMEVDGMSGVNDSWRRHTRG